MTKTLLTVFLLLIFNLGFTQVNFFSGSLDEAMKKAGAEGKFVFLQFEAADCEQCNDVANKAFENKELAAKMEQTFVCLKITASNEERTKIATTYQLSPQKSFGTLFLDNNGTLLNTFHKTTTFYKEYLSQIDIALNKAGEVLNLTALENVYKNGNKGFGFLELLLQGRKAVQLPIDTLLDEYIQALPADSLTSIRTLTFIAKMAPLLDSKAYKALRANQVLFNRMWYSMSMADRVNINNTIIYKGMEKAIRDKDEKLAMRTAAYAQGTNGDNAAAGAKAYDMNMLRYYDEIKDTANYLGKSIAYYKRYFLSATPDSIKRADSINMKRMLAVSKKDTVKEGDHMRISAQVMYAPMAQRFSSELNNGAYNFYLRTDNPYLLSIATEWAKRALDFFETPQALNTYSKLLYKQNQKSAAVEEMEKAIALQKKRGFPTKEYEATLAKMNNNAKLTD